jgi:hypothetical protein
VFENSVLRGIIGRVREELEEDGENCILRSFILVLFTGYYQGH